MPFSRMSSLSRASPPPGQLAQKYGAQYWAKPWATERIGVPWIRSELVPPELRNWNVFFEYWASTKKFDVMTPL